MLSEIGEVTSTGTSLEMSCHSLCKVPHINDRAKWTFLLQKLATGWDSMHLKTQCCLAIGGIAQAVVNSIYR